MGEPSAWEVVLAASRLAEQARRRDQVSAGCVLTANTQLECGPQGSEGALLAWDSVAGWRSLLAPDDPRRSLVELYLPVCGAGPLVIGHLGQSLDGFVATHGGDSRWVTGQENILHLHRLRALCDTVVVGALTVAADDPQLTTRHVEGPSPLRVIFDPNRRLTDQYGVFQDTDVPTLYVCSASLVQPGETHNGSAPILGLPIEKGRPRAATLVEALRRRGCQRILVEGGGVTVSRFLEDDLLDRLHLAIAPVFIGDGRPAIRLAPAGALDTCRRPRHRVFRMGGDILFDCDLTSAGRDGEDTDRGGGDDSTSVVRVY